MDKRNTFLIAEIGQAHDGSLGILHSYIDALSKTGVHAIKFQTHIAHAESSEFEPFRTKFSYVDQTRYDYWKRMEFTLEQWLGIKKHCDEVGLEFISSPFSNEAVDLLEKVGVQRYKIGSGEVSNFLLLDKIVKLKKPIIVSSGMSTYDELDKTVQFINQYNIDLSILQCTTSYPTPPEKLGLNVIAELKSRYPDKKIGYSDHSGQIYSGIAAVAIGAEILEFHAVFDKKMFGPDASSSLEINEISKLVEGVKFLDRANEHLIDKNNIEDYKLIRKMFQKSLSINKSLKEGHVIQLEDLESKKPAGHGIEAADFQSVIGKKLIRDMKQWSFLNVDDISNE